jgi:hypothetical protein
MLETVIRICIYEITNKCGYQLQFNICTTKHIFVKQKQVGITLTKMYWLLGHKSFSYIKQYSNQSGPTEYNSGVRFPLPTYEILERFQSMTLRMIVDAPWYMPNTVIRRDLQIQTVKEEIAIQSPLQCTPK